MIHGERFSKRYGPWALIAGGSEGLGAAFSLELARRGLNVCIVGRRENLLEEIASEIGRRGSSNREAREVRTIACDLSSQTAPEEIARRTADLDVGLLVYNAAATSIGPFLDADEAILERIVEVNCRAPLLLARTFGRRMVARSGRGGGLLLVSSLAGLQGSPLVATYGASKAFGRTLAEALWYELRPAGVDVLACVAGATLTPNYVNSKPNPSRSAPGELAPETVAIRALDALGHGPITTVGRINQAAAFLLSRLVPRGLAVSIMASSVRTLYASARSVKK